jgi:3-hydroxy acid dehydrogenase/malonic semialdehyde reductase
MYTLKDKTILITGASSGFGRAIALALAPLHCRIIIAARREQQLQQLSAQLTKLDCQNHVMVLDVSCRDSVAKAFSALPAAWSEVDVLVNNAGLALGLDAIQTGDIDDWETMIDTNLKGTLYVTRQVLPGMLSRDEGYIVNIGSIAGRETYSGGVVYCASKYAVRAFTEGLRKDILGSNVRVSLISPGMAETQFSTVRFYGDEAKAKNVYTGVSALTAEDVAETVLFCLTRPPHVNISDITLYPTAQASATQVARTDEECAPK